MKFFPELKIVNLSSHYEGWVSDVSSILKEISTADTMTSSSPELPWIELKERLKSLKYVCLVGSLSIFVGGGKCSNDGLKALKDLVNSFPKEYDPIDEKKLDHNHDNDSIFYRLREVHSKKPEYYEGTVVDCYGVYVTSVQKWLSHNTHKNGAMNDLFDEIKNNPDRDGPAIFLCPEKIDRIYQLLVHDFPFNEELNLHSNPSRTFLKMTLLHEMGHHVYPFQSHQPYALLWEAMANWFCYNFLSRSERYLLYLKTRGQDVRYQAYEGIMFLINAGKVVPKKIWWADEIQRLRLLYYGETVVRNLESTLFNVANLPITPFLNEFIDVINFCIRENTSIDSMLISVCYLLTDIENLNANAFDSLKAKSYTIKSVNRVSTSRNSIWQHERTSVDMHLLGLFL